MVQVHHQLSLSFNHYQARPNPKGIKEVPLPERRLEKSKLAERHDKTYFRIAPEKKGGLKATGNPGLFRNLQHPENGDLCFTDDFFRKNNLREFMFQAGV